MMAVFKKLNGTGRELSLISATVMAAMVAGCGASFAQEAWKSVQVPIGGGKTITVEGPPRIAYFTAGGHDNYLTVRADQIAKNVQKISGATVATFDPNWDAQKQLNMMQNAITSGKFNVFLVDTLDGDSECNILTKDAPAANIAVVNMSGAICHLYTKPDGRDGVADGTIGAVGNNSIAAIHDYLKYMVKENPGPQKVLVISGAPTHPLSREIEGALAMIKQEHPEFEVVAYVNTNHSTIDGYNKTQPLLVAHPEANVIFSAFADISTGVLKAVKETGRNGQVKIYDQYGNKVMVSAIKRGDIAATTGGYPRGSVDAAFSMISSAFKGKPFPRVILGDGGPQPADPSKWSGVNIVDKTNLDAFVPEF